MLSRCILDAIIHLVNFIFNKFAYMFTDLYKEFGSTSFEHGYWWFDNALELTGKIFAYPFVIIGLTTLNVLAGIAAILLPATLLLTIPVDLIVALVDKIAKISQQAMSTEINIAENLKQLQQEFAKIDTKDVFKKLKLNSNDLKSFVAEFKNKTEKLLTATPAKISLVRNHDDDVVVSHKIKLTK